MNSIREIIRQAQKELICNTCKRKFDFEEIRFKGQLEKTIFLQTVCMNNHRPTIMVFMAPYQGNVSFEPITNSELLDFYKQITQYKGSLNKTIK